MALAHATRRLIRGSAEIDVLSGIDKLLDHGFVIEHLPCRMDLIELRMGLGATRHEQRAAIRGGLGRNVIGADLFGAGDDLLLIGTDKRPEDGNINDFVNRHDILKCLRGYLAQGLAGYKRLSALELGDSLRNGVHDATIHDDPEIAGASDGDFTLTITKGDDI